MKQWGKTRVFGVVAVLALGASGLAHTQETRSSGDLEIVWRFTAVKTGDGPSHYIDSRGAAQELASLLGSDSCLLQSFRSATSLKANQEVSSRLAEVAGMLRPEQLAGSLANAEMGELRFQVLYDGSEVKWFTVTAAASDSRYGRLAILGRSAEQTKRDGDCSIVKETVMRALDSLISKLETYHPGRHAETMVKSFNRSSTIFHFEPSH